MCQTENERGGGDAQQGFYLRFFTFSLWLCPLWSDGQLSLSANETTRWGSCQKHCCCKKTTRLSWMLWLYTLLHISNFLQLQLFCLLKSTSCLSNKLARRSNVFSFSADVKWQDWETLQEVNTFLSWDSFKERLWSHCLNTYWTFITVRSIDWSQLKSQPNPEVTKCDSGRGLCSAWLREHI